MIIRVSPEKFLEKLKEAAGSEEPKPIEVHALRHIVPVFVEVEDGMKLEQAVVTHLNFEFNKEKYETREQVVFDRYGEANLTELKVWEMIVTKRLLKNVQPIRSTRTGAF